MEDRAAEKKNAQDKLDSDNDLYARQIKKRIAFGKPPEQLFNEMI